MPPKPDPQAPADVSGSPLPAELPAPKLPVYNWDDLLPSTDAPAHVVTSTAVDVLTEIPAPIRHRIENSLMAGIVAKVEWITANKKPENFRPQWKIQPVADEAQGREFVRLVNRYAKYRPDHWEGRDTRTPEGQITVRTGAPTLIVKAQDGSALAEGDRYWAVRYQAKPLERKDPKRLPGTSNGSPKPGDWQSK